MYNEILGLQNTREEKLAKMIELVIKDYLATENNRITNLGARLSEFTSISLKYLGNLPDENKLFLKHILVKYDGEMSNTYGISVNGRNNLPIDKLIIKVETSKWAKTAISFSSEFVQRASIDFGNIKRRKIEENFESEKNVSEPDFEVKIFNQIVNISIQNLKSYANSASEEIIRLREENNILKQKFADLEEELANTRTTKNSLARSSGRQKRLRADDKTPAKSIVRNLLNDHTPQESTIIDNYHDDELSLSLSLSPNDTLACAIGRLLIEIYKIFDKIVAKIYKDNSYTNGIFKNKHASNKTSNEMYRKLKKFMLFLIVIPALGRGIKNIEAHYFKEQLGFCNDSRPLKKAMKDKKELMDLLAEGEENWDHEKIMKYFQLEDRKLRSDMLKEEDKLNIIKGWDALTEVSPNKDDLCRFYKLVPNGEPSRFETHQIHYNYRTIEEITQHIYDTTVKNYNVASSFLN